MASTRIIVIVAGVGLAALVLWRTRRRDLAPTADLLADLTQIARLYQRPFSEGLLAEIKALNTQILAAEAANDGVAICCERDGVVAISKPSGMTCDAVKAAMSARRPNWCNIHRVDKSVSGCLVGSEMHDVRSKLQRAIRERECSKVYCALVQGGSGSPAERQSRALPSLAPGAARIIDSPLVCSEFGKKRELACATFVRSIWGNGVVQLWLCFPITGRYHQIRRHLAAVQADILSVGEKKEGGGKSSKIYLHSIRYDFPGLSVRAPVPPWAVHVDGIDAQIDAFVSEGRTVKEAFLREHPALAGENLGRMHYG